MMERYVCSLVMLLVLSLPVAGICAAADQGTAGMQPGARSSMGGDVAGGVTGKVVETMTKGEYTYVNLEKDGKKVWAAFPAMTVTVGQELSSLGCMPMMDFESKALNRTFPMIMFCNSPLTSAEAELMQRKSTGSNVEVPVSKEKIVIDAAKGDNVYTVAQCYEKRDELHNKQVTVKGKVMKVSAKIMGVNWIHLQDGTGDAAKKTNNLVVTSKSLPKVGDVITATGTLFMNKDFGSGYRYKVIVEMATINN